MAAAAGSRPTWDDRLHQASVGALYLHLPFCRRKCAYCDFASWATDPHDPLMAGYLDALGRLADEACAAGLLATCETAYVGGGTPTLAGGRLVDLVGRVRCAAPGIEELSCEANPDSLGDELIAALAEVGCTRLSVGVQSLDDGELAALGRLHTARQARERLTAAPASGLDVSCDLMCAIPGQTDASWDETLCAAIGLGLGHVSVYPLQIEEGTPLGERYGDADPAWNDPDVQAARMQAAAQRLASAGYERYEVASYARPGKRCRHNEAYWTAVPYLGLGTSAASMLTREGYGRLRAVAPQLPVVPPATRRIRLTCTSDRRAVAQAQGLADLRFELELLSEAQAAAEDLMLALRMVRGAGPELVAHARAVLGDAVDEALAWCGERGLVRQEDGAWQPTGQGWLLGNELYGRMWELAPGDVGTMEA